MIKEAMLESFFIVMNTKDDRLLHNSYLNRQLEKTDFLFPSIPKAFYIQPSRPERSQLINLTSAPDEQLEQSSSPSNIFETGSQNPKQLSEKTRTLQSNKHKSKREGLTAEEGPSEAESSYEAFKMKFDQKDLTESDIESLYSELISFEEVVGKQVQIRREPESSLGTRRESLIEEYKFKIEAFKKFLAVIEKFTQKKNNFHLCIYLYTKIIQQVKTQQFVYCKDLGEHESLVSFNNPFFKTQRKPENLKKRLSQKEYIQELNQASESNIKNMKINTIKRKSNAQTPKSARNQSISRTSSETCSSRPTWAWRPVSSVWATSRTRFRSSRRPKRSPESPSGTRRRCRSSW